MLHQTVVQSIVTNWFKQVKRALKEKKILGIELFYSFLLNKNIAKMLQFKSFKKKRTPRFHYMFLSLAVAVLLYMSTSSAVLYSSK